VSRKILFYCQQTERLNANWSILEKPEDRCFFSHPSSDLSEALMKQPKKSFTGKQARCIQEEFR